MSGAGLPTLVLPLLQFVQRLGLPQSNWSHFETISVLSFTVKVPKQAASALTPTDFNALKQVYGPALKTLVFAAEDEPGALPALELNEEIDDSRLARFRNEISKFDPYLQFVLDKDMLTQQLFPSIPSHHRILFYFFPEALERLLSNRFDDLEDQLWPAADSCKVILLIPSNKILIDGDHLAIIGGTHLDSLANLTSSMSPDISRTKGMFDYCRTHLIWRKDWVERLTPLHFDVTVSDSGDTKIVQLLQIHLATLVILYTAQLTAEAKGHLVSTYVGSQYTANIIVPTVEEALLKRLPETSEHLLNVLNAVYDPIWLERGRGLLPIVQSVVSERLQPTPPEDAFEVFVGFAETLESSIELQWQAIFENKLTAYFAQVKALEEHIASTVSSISQQITDMVKGLSDTMLAAVAVIVGTFIADLFTDEFNAQLFSVGLLVYGTYVLIFPLSYNMLARCSNFKALISDYKKRRDNFKSQMTDGKISTIEGGRIQDRKNSFTRWFWATVATYLIVVVLSYFAGISALEPNNFVVSITSSASSPPTAASPKPTVMLTVIPTSIPTSGPDTTR
ncbi:MAG TPA: hypothetical protein VGE04_00480 [Chloroflexia bacterium]